MFRELHETRQREQIDEMICIVGIDQAMQLFPAHGDGRSRHEHAARSVGIERLFHGGLHPDDGNVVAAAHLVRRDGRRRIARDDDRLRALLLHEEAEGVPHEAAHLVDRLCPIGHMVAVCKE